MGRGGSREIGGAHLRDLIKSETRLALCIEIPAVGQAVVCADNHLFPDKCQLLGSPSTLSSFLFSPSPPPTALLLYPSSPLQDTGTYRSINPRHLRRRQLLLIILLERGP